MSPNQPQPAIKVLIVDDHPAVRAGIRTLLAQQPDMLVMGECSSASAAVTADQTPPDVAVVDYHLGDRNGLWVARRLRLLHPAPRILIYSAFADGALAAAAIVAGAHGLLSKSAIGGELCTAIRRLYRGQPYLPAISPTLARSMGASLSAPEQALFGLLLHGVAETEIAAQLEITPAELEAGRAAILAVLAPAATRARIPHAGQSPLHYHRRRGTPTALQAKSISR